MKRLVYSCDLCHRDFEYSDKYDPESGINGLCLVTPICTWQRLLLDSGGTIDICVNCCKTIAHLTDMKIVYPINIRLDFELDSKKKTNIKGAKYTVDENDIRSRLNLKPNTFSPAEIIIWDDK